MQFTFSYRELVLAASCALYLIQNLEPLCNVLSVQPPDVPCMRLPRGDTTVRETAPATPPAMNEARTGCAIYSLALSHGEGVGGGFEVFAGVKGFGMLGTVGPMGGRELMLTEHTPAASCAPE